MKKIKRVVSLFMMSIFILLLFFDCNKIDVVAAEIVDSKVVNELGGYDYYYYPEDAKNYGVPKYLFWQIIQDGRGHGKTEVAGKEYYYHVYTEFVEFDLPYEGSWNNRLIDAHYIIYTYEDNVKDAYYSSLDLGKERYVNIKVVASKGMSIVNPTIKVKVPNSNANDLVYKSIKFNASMSSGAIIQRGLDGIQIAANLGIGVSSGSWIKVLKEIGKAILLITNFDTLEIKKEVDEEYDVEIDYGAIMRYGLKVAKLKIGGTSSKKSGTNVYDKYALLEQVINDSDKYTKKRDGIVKFGYNADDVPIYVVNQSLKNMSKVEYKYKKRIEIKADMLQGELTKKGDKFGFNFNEYEPSSMLLYRENWTSDNINKRKIDFEFTNTFLVKRSATYRGDDIEEVVCVHKDKYSKEYIVNKSLYNLSSLKNSYSSKVLKKKFLEVSLQSNSTDITTYTYTGKQIKPDVNVRYNYSNVPNDYDEFHYGFISSVNLVKGKDFLVSSYKNNIKVGTSKIIIKGAGVFGGEIYKEFKIVPRRPSITIPMSTSTMAVIQWKKIPEATGYIVERKTNNGNYVQVIKLESNNALCYTDAKRTNGNTYTYRVRAYGIDNTDGKSVLYSSYSKALKD